MTRSVPPRWLVTCVVAIGTGAFITARVLHEPHWPTDFDQLWFAARALTEGRDPYSVVGPGREFPWMWPLYYPMPAVLLAVPFSLLPIVAARIAFTTFAAATLGWALAPRLRTHWPMLLSAAFIISASRNQWAPVLLAAAWVPALGFLTTSKPNVGLTALTTLERKRDAWMSLGGCLVIVALSFLARPDWLHSWRSAIATAPHIQAAVLTLPAGPLLALAALRWKRPEARLFLAFITVPHTPSLYDLLILFFVCRTLREALTLGVLTQGLYWGIVSFGSFPTFDRYAEGLGAAAIFIVYLPMLVILLRRPNRSSDDPPGTDAAVTLPRALPSTWIDTILFSLLLVGATMLVWLPLVTYRQ